MASSPETTIPDAVEESARGLDAIAECASILPGYQSIARRAAATMRELSKALEEANDAAEANAAWGGRMKQERDALRKDLTDEGE